MFSGSTKFWNYSGGFETTRRNSEIGVTDIDEQATVVKEFLVKMNRPVSIPEIRKEIVSRLGSCPRHVGRIMMKLEGNICIAESDDGMYGLMDRFTGEV